jgi:hypothetical protein
MNLLLPMLILAVAVSVAMPSAQGQTAGLVVGSETVIYTFDRSVQNKTSFEAKISSNSPFIVSTVLVGTNSSAAPSVSVSEWKIYDSSGKPFIYNSPDSSLPTGSDNEVRAIAGLNILPLGVPEDGSLGAVIEISGFEQGDQTTITFVYIANAGSETSAEILSAAQLPFYVTENSQPESNSTSLEISDSFVNPEIHCEICTAVNATERAEVVYAANATDLAGATKFAFWAMGESGGEDVTFKVAGKAHDGSIDYANTTSVTLDREWKRYEVDLAGADLHEITHLFAFEVNSKETFYVKGAAYY